jgi:hypothetical protein
LHCADTHHSNATTVGGGDDFSRSRRFVEQLHRAEGIEQIGDRLDSGWRRVRINRLKNRCGYADARNAPCADPAPRDKLLKRRSHRLEEEAARRALGLADRSVWHNLTMEKEKLDPVQFCPGETLVEAALKARMGKPGKREFVQVLRLLEVFRPDDVPAGVRAALERGVIGFDAVKHLVLCRIERRPPRLDLTVYPYLPQATVAPTMAKSYLSLLAGGAS